MPIFANEMDHQHGNPDLLEELVDDGLETFWFNWNSQYEDDDNKRKRKAGGSRPGRKPNKNRNYEQRYHRLVAEYFSDNSIYDATDFRRRFRMSRGLFDRVYDGVLDTDPEYFKRKANCTGKLGIHPLLKIVAALRVLANAGSADSLDDNMEMAESTILDSLCHFVDAVDIKFGDQYLRAPTTEDVSRLLDMNRRRGFVGMLFSIDCMHWEWQNCPASLAGQFKSKEKKPMMELEACADQDLWTVSGGRAR